MRVAIVGSGISGLAAAHRLAKSCQVTLFEADARAGGHANSVDVSLDGFEYPVDTGFLVLNESTYPNLLSLFAELDVELANSEMTFSASMQPDGVEWSGTNLRTLFAQPGNLASPKFLGMVYDIFRFNRQATALAESQNQTDGHQESLDEPLEQWLDRNHYRAGFRDWYLLPMAAAIWSCPMQTMRKFPIGSFARFFHNHGLLQVENRPQWFTVKGGSRRYVDKILAGLKDVRLSTPVTGVSRARYAQTGKVEVRTNAGVEEFDALILAAHSPQSLALLDDPTEHETNLIGKVRYQRNSAWLHTDVALMPRQKLAWAAWNYFAGATQPDKDPLVDGEPRVSVTYWLNKLQPLPFSTPIMVTLNPVIEPRQDQVIQQLEYEHPVLDEAAVSAQKEIRRLQGNQATWYAGAWLGYGFHEDGLISGLAAASGVSERLSAQTLAQAA